jgi:hypothetical protein
LLLPAGQPCHNAVFMGVEIIERLLEFFLVHPAFDDQIIRIDTDFMQLLSIIASSFLS